MIAGVAAALIGFSATVQAVPILTLTDSLGNTTGPIAANGAGLATYNGALGNWSINVAAGLSTGSATLPVIDLSDNSVFTAGRGNILTITWVVDNLGPLAGLFKNDVGGTLNGTTDAFSVLLNNVLLGSTLSFNATPFSGSQTASINAAGNANTVTLTAVLTAQDGGQTSFNDHWNANLPDGGATVMLLGAALTAMGLLRRKLIA